tara:strand:+ start:69496 stop:70272 length:777 start_codon:yes stop_codon:yes gene_type:complete
MIRFISIIFISVSLLSSCENSTEEPKGKIVGLIYDDYHSQSRFLDVNHLRYEFHAFDFESPTELSAIFNSSKQEYFSFYTSTYLISDTLGVPFDSAANINILFENDGLLSFFSDQMLQKFEGPLSSDYNQADSSITFSWPFISGTNFTHISYRVWEDEYYIFRDTLLTDGSSFTLDLRPLINTSGLAIIVTMIKGPLPNDPASNVEGDIEAQILIGSRFSSLSGNPVYEERNKSLPPYNLDFNSIVNSMLFDRLLEDE